MSKILAGSGTTLLLAVIEIIPLGTTTKMVTAAVLAILSVLFYSIALWQWVDQFHYYQRSTRVKQDFRLKLFTVGSFVAIWLLAFLFYHRLIPIPLDETRALLDRYRQALKIENNPGRTTLIELSNTDLKDKGILLYKKIREINSFHEKRLAESKAKGDAKAKADEEMRVQNEYDTEVKTDALMVLDELRGRIPYERRKNIMGLPNINPADPKAGSVSVYRAPWGAPFDLFFSKMIAGEIEELVKLLPD